MLQPAKVLLLYAHLETKDSIANRVLLQSVQRQENVTVHDLYVYYPDFLLIFTMNSSCCASIR
nr:glutathione-regulated potassium-efflux system ancillaryprotein KefG [Candidatus Pantoea persica]